MIDKITMAVGSMDAMTGFYAHVFGITFKKVEMFGHTLNQSRLGDMELLLCPKELADIKATDNTIQLRFIVPDVAAAYAEGLRCGGSSMNEPTEQNGVTQAALRDPDGNSLELTSG